MRHRWLVLIRWYSLAWALIMVIGCAGMVQQTSGPEDNGAGLPRQLQTHQVIVTLPPASRPHWGMITETLAQSYDLTRVGAFPLTSLGVQCVVFQVPTGRSVDDVMKHLAADPWVESAQRNQRFQGLGLAHSDEHAPRQYGARAIRANVAHRWATGRGVKVAVVDTGVALEHPDLHGQIVTHANFVEGGEQTFGQDIHGTAVAGVIAARAGNGIGIFGIAPEAAIVALKACWQLDPRQAVCSSWSLQRAVDFANEAGVQLLNLSLTGPPDPLLERLLITAEKRGITVVAAALHGERVEAPGFPASMTTVMGVLASDRRGHVRGAVRGMPTPLLAAPGEEIITTVPPRAYNFMSGSSLAAAHVTGIAALLLEREPGLSPAHVRAILGTTARPAKSSGGTSQPAIGVVDAYAALARLLRVQAGSQGVEAHSKQHTTAAINPKSAKIPPLSF
jgi:subtilisin family serine protease